MFQQSASQTALLLALGFCSMTSITNSLAERAGAAEDKDLVLIGTYTSGADEGIYSCELDRTTGALRVIATSGHVKNPSFLAIHPNRKTVYAVSEVADYAADGSGAVSSFHLDANTGRLTPLNHQSSTSAGPCHVVVDAQGKNALVANYGGGTAAVLPIGGDGRLAPASSFVRHQGKSVNAGRQEGPHPHSINLDAANRFAFVADLGTDKVMVYRFDAATGKIAANDPPAGIVAPGAGPRHFAFHPDGRHAYVINELDSTVTPFDYDAKRGTLTARKTVSTLPQDFHGENTTAEVQVHPSGKFLYGSNRGHDSLAIFTINADGDLTPVGHQPTGGKTPRNFGIHPDGKLLLAANQDSGTVKVFLIDQTRGTLQPTSHQIEVPKPVCVKFLVK